jgi:hypothetical protein
MLTRLNCLTSSTLLLPYISILHPSLHPIYLPLINPLQHLVILLQQSPNLPLNLIRCGNFPTRLQPLKPCLLHPFTHPLQLLHPHLSIHPSLHSQQIRITRVQIQRIVNLIQRLYFLTLTQPTHTTQRTRLLVVKTELHSPFQTRVVSTPAQQ